MEHATARRPLPWAGWVEGAVPADSRATTAAATSAATARSPAGRGRIGQGAIMQPSNAESGFMAVPPSGVRSRGGPIIDAGASAV